MTDTTAEAAIEAAAAIERLRAGYATRYGAAVFDLDLRVDTAGRPVLEGTVLVPSQRDDALEAVRRELGSAVVDGVVVLLESEGGSWCTARGRVDVLSRPDGDLATQVQAGDPPIRRLLERERWSVIELADGTVGWCRAEGIVPLAPEFQPQSRDEWRAAFRGSWHAPESGWRAAVESWLGTPYLWGGSTPEGVDCSGFVQRVVRQSAGLGLPKHSADQLRAGRRVTADKLLPGDLVYLTRLDDGVRHIALVVDTGPPVEVAHAGREHGVAIEPLQQLLARYQLRGACRLGPDSDEAKPA